MSLCILYRTQYSTQHVFILLLKDWRKNLDNNYFVGAVFIDLSKAFDGIAFPLIAKPTAYGFHKKS